MFFSNARREPAFDGCEDVDEAADGGPKALEGAFGGFAQERFQFGEGILNLALLWQFGGISKQPQTFSQILSVGLSP